MEEEFTDERDEIVQDVSAGSKLYEPSATQSSMHRVKSIRSIDAKQYVRVEIAIRDTDQIQEP
jgi:hypothetical protein